MKPSKAQDGANADGAGPAHQPGHLGIKAWGAKAEARQQTPPAQHRRQFQTLMPCSDWRCPFTSRAKEPPVSLGHWL
eukprot:15431603-Alexandrium_andersonii.AAC.1